MLNPNFKPYKAYYVFKGGDTDTLTVTGEDTQGNAWVTWDKDGFKNMVPLSRLRKITKEIQE